MNSKYFFLFILFFSLGACSRGATKAIVEHSAELVHFEAEVVDPNCPLAGSLVIEPFKSGEGVFSNPEVSQASLMMVKGFADAMQEKPSPLNVIVDDKTDKAKFYIKGYVTAYQKPQGMMNRLKKVPNVFAVEGKLINLETDRVILRFSSRAQSIQDKDLNDFAYKSGQRLARYLLGQDKEKP